MSGTRIQTGAAWAYWSHWSYWSYERNEANRTDRTNRTDKTHRASRLRPPASRPRPPARGHVVLAEGLADELCLAVGRVLDPVGPRLFFNFHTQIITTSPKVRITGATHRRFTGSGR